MVFIICLHCGQLRINLTPQKNNCNDPAPLPRALRFTPLNIITAKQMILIDNHSHLKV